LKESSNEKIERLGVLEEKFSKVMERLDVLEGSSIRRWKGGSRGGQDERKFNEKKWKGWGVLEGRFSEEMERLKCT